MTETYTRIWLHLLFSTKNGLPLIAPPSENQIHQHLYAQLTECKCQVKIVNGTQDHVHLLFRLNHRIALTDIVKQIKGNTSHWINDNNLCEDKFVWQKGFYAFAVSDCMLKASVIRLNSKTLITKGKHSFRNWMS